MPGPDPTAEAQVIDPELLGLDGHLVRVCPRCYLHAVRVSCPVLGTLREELLGTASDVYDCPGCSEVTRMACPINGTP